MRCDGSPVGGSTNRQARIATPVHGSNKVRARRGKSRRLVEERTFANDWCLWLFLDRWHDWPPTLCWYSHQPTCTVPGLSCMLLMVVGKIGTR